MGAPQSAGEAGANLHKNFLSTLANLPSLVGDAVTHVPVLAPAAAGARAVPEIAANARDFFGGLATGQAPVAQLGEPRTGSLTVALPLPRGPMAQAKAPVTAGGVKAPVYTAEYLATQPNFVQQILSGAAKAPAQAATQTQAAQAKAANPFDEAVARFATANGGISLNELAALSRSASETSVLRTQPKDPSAKDVAGAEMLKLADAVQAQRNKEIAAADASKRGALTESAVAERAKYLQSILGANPVDVQTAAAMSAGG